MARNWFRKRRGTDGPGRTGCAGRQAEQPPRTGEHALLDLGLERPEPGAQRLLPESCRALRERLDELEHQHGPAHEDTIETRSRLATMLTVLALAAERLRPGDTQAHEHALALHVENIIHASRALGADSFDALSAWEGAGSVALSAGWTEKSIGLLEEAVAGYRRAAGPDDERTQFCCSRLAEAYEAANRADEAITMWEQVVETGRRTLRPGDVMLGERKERLFRAYHQAGRNPEAIALCEEIIADKAEFSGPDDLSVFIWTDNLAHLLHDAGAIACYERAIHGLTEITGPRHPDLAFRHHNLAIAHLEDGHPQRALPHLERALAIREGALGPHHADTLDSLLKLTSGYEQAGRLEKAVACAQRLVIALERVAPQHPRLPELRAYRERLADPG